MVILSCDCPLAFLSPLSRVTVLSSHARLPIRLTPLFHGRMHRQQLAMHHLDFSSYYPHPCRVSNGQLSDFNRFSLSQGNSLSSHVVRPSGFLACVPLFFNRSVPILNSFYSTSTTSRLSY